MLSYYMLQIYEKNRVKPNYYLFIFVGMLFFYTFVA